MEKWKLRKMSVVACICLVITACGGSNGSGSGAAGKLSISITDAPIYDAQSVIVNFTAAEIKPDEGPALKFSFCEDPDEDPDDTTKPPLVQPGECVGSAASIQSIDLLKQTGGASFLLLDRVDVPAGKVNWVRLVLTDPAGKIVLSTGEPVLTVPSGNQTGLKLNRGFDIPAGEEVKVYIDFDVRKSIVVANGEYQLKPTLRLVEDFGAIAGKVDMKLLPTSCLGPSVYVFAGADATPDDIDRDQGDPISSAAVVLDNDLGGYSYRADFLPPGDYTAAFVCADGVLPDGGATFNEPADEPDRDDTLSFTLAEPTSTATVVDNQTVAIDF